MDFLLYIRIIYRDVVNDPDAIVYTNDNNKKLNKSVHRT